VATLLRQTIDGQGMVLACFMSRMEVLYRVWKDEDERQARLADAQLQSLPICWVAASDPLLERAAAIKICHALSVADAWIAAAVRQEGAVLVHKDPEFQAINSLAQEWLA
jgi:predicted nucleic acid-binding protein